MEDFYIYLTFDIDQDFNPGSDDYYNRTTAKFDSFGDGFQRIIDMLDGKDFSVFLRSDRQINETYGSYHYLINNNQKLIDNINCSNGEINWHAHLYKCVNEQWLQIKNKQELVDAFLVDYDTVKNIDEINSNIIRIGECVMNNLLMKAMDDVGIRIDSTALPGRKRDDQEKFFDWEITTNNIYNPSMQDYRTNASEHYALAEIPMSTLSMKASYDQSPIRRYFNLAFYSNILFQNFAAFVQQHNSIVTITHPFEVLAPGSHGLLSYNLNVFGQNIQLLDDQVRAYGKNPVFRKISQVTAF